MDLEVYIQLIFLCVVNILFTCAGVVLNALVIVSFLKSSLYLRKKLCNFMIMVLSCFDLLVVITTHPLLAFRLVLWLNEKHDLFSKMQIYANFSTTIFGFSFVALLVMNIERYLGAYYPFFHRTTVTKRKLLKLLAILLILPLTLILISVNDWVISFPTASIIFVIIINPPFVFINYKLFKISRKMRRDNTTSPEVSTLHVNLKNISTCLLAVACLVLLSIPGSFFFAFNFVEESTSENVMLSDFWTSTVATANSTLNCLIFFWKNKVLRREGIKVLKTLKGCLFAS